MARAVSSSAPLSGVATSIEHVEFISRTPEVIFNLANIATRSSALVDLIAPNSRAHLSYYSTHLGCLR